LARPISSDLKLWICLLHRIAAGWGQFEASAQFNRFMILELF